MDGRFKEIFAQALDIPIEQVTDDLGYKSIPEWDSLAHIALITSLDMEYNTMLDTEDVIDMSSVRKAREILKKYGVDV